MLVKLFVSATFAWVLFTLPEDDRWSAILHPYNLIPLVFIYFLTRMTDKAIKTKNIAPLDDTERELADWWLINGTILHSLINGLSAISPFLLPFFPEPSRLHYPLHTYLKNVDTRHFSDAHVLFLKFTELLILTPLCCTMYYGAYTRAAWRAPLQILTATAQLYTVLIYVGSALLDKTPLSSFPHFSCQFATDTVFFFWGPIFALIIWTIVPLYGIYKALREIQSGIEINLPNTIALSDRTFVFSPSAFSKSRPSKLPTTPMAKLENVEYEIVLSEEKDTIYFLDNEEATSPVAQPIDKLGSMFRVRDNNDNHEKPVKRSLSRKSARKQYNPEEDVINTPTHRRRKSKTVDGY